jgi:hypothetical protein
MSLIALLAALGASSAAATPSGEYAVFADCPVSNLELAACLVSRTESGEITLGKQAVPIVATQTLQGGYTEEGSGAEHFVGAADGNTLSKTPQKVPGGLVGLVKCNEITGSGLLEDLARAACELVFENGVTGVNATTELAAPASSIGINEENVLEESGTGLSLPIKVKLENPLLGSECYIGSNAHPVVLNLTSGTSGAAKGKRGKLSDRAEGGILVITGDTLVDNTFAAPAATGCGGLFSSLIDPLVNSKVGLPAAAGTNTAILNNTLEQSGADLARESGE